MNDIEAAALLDETCPAFPVPEEGGTGDMPPSALRHKPVPSTAPHGWECGLCNKVLTAEQADILKAPVERPNIAEGVARSFGQLGKALSEKRQARESQAESLDLVTKLDNDIRAAFEREKEHLKQIAEFRNERDAALEERDAARKDTFWSGDTDELADALTAAEAERDAALEEIEAAWEAFGVVDPEEYGSTLEAEVTRLSKDCMKAEAERDAALEDEKNTREHANLIETDLASMTEERDAAVDRSEKDRTYSDAVREERDQAGNDLAAALADVTEWKQMHREASLQSNKFSRVLHDMTNSAKVVESERDEAVGLLVQMEILPDSTYWVYGSHRDETDPPWIDRVRACVSKHERGTVDARPLNLIWGKHVRDGEFHTEWHAPCNCAYHPEPEPHVHSCLGHRKVDLNVENPETTVFDKPFPSGVLECGECSGTGWFSPTPVHGDGWTCNACKGTGINP